MEFNHLFDFEVTNVQEVTEGFSVDRKFIVNDCYLIRLICEGRVEQFKKVFEVQKKFQQVSLCQKVLSFIIDKPHSYYITEYIPGKNGLEVIRNYSEKEQYDFGVIAGFELTKFHKTYPEPSFDVKSYVQSYFNSKVKIARNNNVSKLLPEIEDIIQVVKDNIHLLYDLKGVVTHSDYHLFNMIFDDKNYMGVIDFERARVNHFLTDFRNNTPHNSGISPKFASGFIDGYLDVIKVDNFFAKYNVNDLLMCIAAIPWILEFNPNNINQDVTFIKHLFAEVKEISVTPKWYAGKY